MNTRIFVNNFLYDFYKNKEAVMQFDGPSSFMKKKDFDPSGFCIKSSYQDPVREFSFFVVFDSHFPDFCSRKDIFYKQLVASGNSLETRPAFPVIPAIPVKWGRRVRRGPSLPYAPGATMTVVHTNSFKLLFISPIFWICCLVILLQLFLTTLFLAICFFGKIF